MCCAAFLCFILRASRVERQRIQMEQLQTSLNLQVTQAMREIEALRLSQQRASTYRHDLRHHMQFLAGCIEKWPHRAGAGLHPQRVQRDRGRQGDRYCENGAANLIFLPLPTAPPRPGYSSRCRQASRKSRPSRRAICACCFPTHWKTPCTPPCAAAKPGTKPLSRPPGTEERAVCRSLTGSIPVCSSGWQLRSPTSPATGLGCAASAPSAQAGCGGLTSFAAKDGQFTCG